MSSYVRFYVLQLKNAPDYQQYPIDNGTRYYNCDRQDSFGVMRTTMLSYWAWSIRHDMANYPNRVKTTLQGVACGRAPLSEDDLAFIWFLRSPLGKVLKAHQFPIYGLDPFSETPEALFTCNTTPWIGSVSAKYAPQEKPAWNDIGMNQYYGFGLTPVHTWIAKQHFYQTKWGVLFDLTPFLGGAYAAAERWETLYEGRDVNGVPQSRLVAGGLFASFYALAMVDYIGATRLGTQGVRTLAKLRKLAKVAASPAEIAALLGKIRGVARLAPSLGDNLAQFRGLFGTPLSALDQWKQFRSAWRPSTEAGSKLFGEGMSLFIEGGVTREGTAIVGAQEHITHALAGGDVDEAFDLAKKAIEDGAAFSTMRTYDGPAKLTDEAILQQVPTSKYGKPFDRSKGGRGFPLIDHGRTPVPPAHLDEFWEFVHGPGHIHENIDPRMFPEKWIRTVETQIGAQTFPTKRIEMMARDAGRAEYIATAEAEAAMWKEMRSMFREAANPATAVERVNELGMRMEHLVNSVIPYEHGSSTIAQGWRTAVSGSRGVTFGEIAQGVGLDLKAWVRTPEQYVAELPTYFKKVDETIDGVAFATPQISVVTMPPPGAPTVVLSGVLDVAGSVKVVATNATARTLAGWIASKDRFQEWETGALPDPSMLSGMHPVFQNPKDITVKAFSTNAAGEAINTGSPLAQSVPSLDATADFSPTTYPSWHKPGFTIDVPLSAADGTYGIWAVWTGTNMMKRIRTDSSVPRCAALDDMLTHFSAVLQLDGVGPDCPCNGDPNLCHGTAFSRTVSLKGFDRAPFLPTKVERAFFTFDGTKYLTGWGSAVIGWNLYGVPGSAPPGALLGEYAEVMFSWGWLGDNCGGSSPSMGLAFRCDGPLPPMTINKQAIFSCLNNRCSVRFPIDTTATLTLGP